MSRDHLLFPSEPSSLLEETSTTKLANWIATRTQLIKVSVQQALKLDTQNTNPSVDFSDDLMLKKNEIVTVGGMVTKITKKYDRSSR